MPRAILLNASVQADVEKAAAALKKGLLVAFPTETVYGLGASALNEKAVLRIFEAKKRPSFDPLIVHVCRRENAIELWKRVPPKAEALMKKFWPGPLTIVLEKNDTVPDVVTSGLATVAVRMPSHPAAQALLQAFGGPIAAPSANLFGYTSPTTAQAVEEDLGEAVDVILDGGPCPGGLESTVVLLEEGGSYLLRPGGIPSEDLKPLLPDLEVRRDVVESAPMLSPGLLHSHYAPWTAMTLMDRPLKDFLKNITETARAYELKGIPWPRIGLLLFEKVPSRGPFEVAETLTESSDMKEAAANLFAAIRKLDKMHLDLIVASSVPEKGLGAAIMDRLRKASGGRVGLPESITEALNKPES